MVDINQQNTQPQLNKHLTTTVKDIMLKIHPDPQAYEVQPGEAERREADPLHPQFSNLLDRLIKRAPATDILIPQATGKARYSDIVKQQAPLPPQPPIQDTLPSLTAATDSTASSTLTAFSISDLLQKLEEKQTKQTTELMESQQKLLASIVATQQQQSKDMLEQFQKTMHEMMAIMFKQTMEMVKTLLPSRNPTPPEQHS